MVQVGGRVRYDKLNPKTGLKEKYYKIIRATRNFGLNGRTNGHNMFHIRVIKEPP